MAVTLPDFPVIRNSCRHYTDCFHGISLMWVSFQGYRKWQPQIYVLAGILAKHQKSEVYKLNNFSKVFKENYKRI